MLAMVRFSPFSALLPKKSESMAAETETKAQFKGVPHTCFKYIAASTLCIALTACMPRYPLGMSEAQWNAMTPSQQQAAIEKQAKKDAEQQRLQAIEARKQAEAEKKRRAELAALYNSGRMGDVIDCEISGGVADFYPGWKQIENVRFSLARSEIQEIEFREKGGRRTQDAFVGFDTRGDRIRVCRRANNISSGYGCGEISGSYGDFERGISVSLNVEGLMNSNTLYCRYRYMPRRGNFNGYGNTYYNNNSYQYNYYDYNSGSGSSSNRW
jgi:hypothetical protein